MKRHKAYLMQVLPISRRRFIQNASLDLTLVNVSTGFRVRPRTVGLTLRAGF
jgi:hypothetical protein